MKRSLLFTGLIVVLWACGGIRQDRTTENTGSGQSLDYEVLLEDSYGGTDTPENRVIKNQKDLESAYGIINRIRRPGIAVPETDFTEKMVVAVFMGRQSSGGNQVKIEKVEETDDAVQVYVMKIHPQEGDMATMAITNPFVFVRLPHSDKEVVFK